MAENHINNTKPDVKNTIKQRHINQKLTNITIKFAINIVPSEIHHTEGIPRLFSNQLNGISKNIAPTSPIPKAHTGLQTMIRNFFTPNPT
jgi:hypothetical protein